MPTKLQVNSRPKLAAFLSILAMACLSWITQYDPGIRLETRQPGIFENPWHLPALA